MLRRNLKFHDQTTFTLMYHFVVIVGIVIIIAIGIMALLLLSETTDHISRTEEAVVN